MVTIAKGASKQRVFKFLATVSIARLKIFMGHRYCQQKCRCSWVYLSWLSRVFRTNQLFYMLDPSNLFVVVERVKWSHRARSPEKIHKRYTVKWNIRNRRKKYQFFQSKKYVKNASESSKKLKKKNLNTTHLF